MNRRLGVLLAALVLFGACGTRVQDWPDDALAPSDYYTTATTPDGAATDGDGEARNAATDTTATTTAKSPRGGRSTATTTAAAAGELPAPAPGTYTYDETSTFDGEQEKQTSTERWSVERSPSSVTLTLSQTEDDGEFVTTSTSTFRVRSSALELIKTTYTFDDEEPESCTYEPPFLVLKLPLTVGSKWTTKSKCGDDEEAEEMEFEVTGTADDVIGGKTVKTFLVRSTDSFDSTDDTGGERTTFSYTDTRHVDPQTLLTVVEDVRFSVGGDATTVHRQLRSLTPS